MKTGKPWTCGCGHFNRGWMERCGLCRTPCGQAYVPPGADQPADQILAEAAGRLSERYGVAVIPRVIGLGRPMDADEARQLVAELEQDLFTAAREGEL